ncbi:hypothetical protein OJAV_G00163350 [Oryzias javanicus]|uniref:Uncharacterized protein n=1 Tax=Oryzias javanicus TaxID=123683 RepID=A0A437CKF1_ORYJA|nr:hypothetical protein OJAV_G00163350 [Oryzias javanicus]
MEVGRPVSADKCWHSGRGGRRTPEWTEHTIGGQQDFFVAFQRGKTSMKALLSAHKSPGIPPSAVGDCALFDTTVNLGCL